MDGRISLRLQSADGNRGQCPAEATCGSGRSTGFTTVTDPFRNTHHWAHNVGRRESPSGRTLCTSPLMTCNRKGCESRVHTSGSLCSGEHRVGKQSRPPVRHYEDQRSSLNTLKRPQESPPAKNPSKNQSGRPLRPVQHRSHMVAGSVDGCPLNVQRASQPLHQGG